ncbi:unnamed protein product [Meloidogyne enterolobii]|uniref:Uncharacterized protein n=1 Tax=Meloidogyne enterolobii TaxID=390850 RepID=A0ACB0Z5G3_MELEN
MKYFIKLNSSLLIISIVLAISDKSQQHRHSLKQSLHPSLPQKTGKQLGGSEYETVNSESSLNGHPLLFEILEEAPQEAQETPREAPQDAPQKSSQEGRSGGRIVGNAPVSSNNQLFQKYLSRGLLTCGTKYIGIIQQLNRLIMTAHKEYTECQQLMNSNNGEKLSPKISAQLEMINELLNDD